MSTGSLRIAAPTPLGYFASLVAEDAGLPLVEAAAAIAHDDFPRADVQSVLSQVDALAERLKRRIPSDAAPLARLRWLNRYFYDELGFAGNVNNYYDPHNSYLHAVLATRRGIPISLAILYVELATQIGLVANGVSFPGHFLVKLAMVRGGQRGEVVIDPMNGHTLSRDELDDMLQPFKRSRGLVGDFDVPVGLFLKAAAPREVLARMLRNLKEIHGAAVDRPRLLAVLRRLIVLLPHAWEEQRDCGLLLADLGRDDEAALHLQTYLQQSPEAEDRVAVARRLAALRPPRPPLQ